MVWSMLMNVTFLIDKNMAIKKLSKLDHILWPIKVYVSSRMHYMLLPEKVNTKKQNKRVKWYLEKSHTVIEHRKTIWWKSVYEVEEWK